MDIYKLIRVITGRLPTGALYFSEKEIRFSILNSLAIGDRKEYVVQLPAGIIENGEVKNKESLKQALLYLSLQANLSKNFKTVVVSVQLPDLFATNIEFPVQPTKEAIELNLSSLSPIPLGRAYLSWQELGASPKTGQNQVLALISPKQIIDDYREVLEKAKFLPLAIEPTAFSSVRFLKFLGGLELFKNYLLITINQFSIELSVLEKLELKSLFFLKENFSDKSNEDIERVSTQIIQRFLNYYEEQTGNAINEFIILSDAYAEPVARAIDVRFNKMPIIFGHQEMSLGEIFSLGAALRGFTLEKADKEMNLLPFKPKTEYYLILLKDFFEIWGLIGLIVALVVVASLFFTRLYLETVKNDVQWASNEAAKSLPRDQFNLLTSQIQSINSQLNSIKTVQGQLVDWPTFFSQIQSLPANVTILNLTMNRSGEGSIKAMAPSRDVAISFKEALSKSHGITNVDLPLNQVQDLGGGNLSFLINFKYKF